MRSSRSLQFAARAVLVGAVCAAVAVSAPLVNAQKERILKDSDANKLGKKLATWQVLLKEDEDTLKAEQDFRDELKKINQKRLKGVDLLSSPADLGPIIYAANDYGRKKPKGAGKVMMHKEMFGDDAVEYALWTPQKYRGSQGPYTLIITLPEEGENPEKHITNHWTNQELRASTIIACPKMPGVANLWTETDGLRSVLVTLRYVMETWAVDVDRVFIGGRARGGEVALAMANMFPARFAGVFAWASDAGKGIPAENLMYVPIIISGGGTNTTEFATRVKDAKLENLTVQGEAGQDEIFAWMAEKRRMNYPTKISVVQGEKFPNKAYWIQFAPVSDDVARVDAEINKETNTITITSKGIRDVSVFLSDELVDLSKPVTVIANGAESTDSFERSINTFLEFIESGKNDPGRIFVATKQYHLPSVASSDDSDG